MSKAWSCGLWLVAIIFFYSSLTYGGTITVATDGSGDHLTIQAGIDAAEEGDVVEITDGEYTGEGNRDITFKGKAITVTGNVADPNSVLINCQATSADPHRGFLFNTGEGKDSILEGVAITRVYTPMEHLFIDGEHVYSGSLGSAIYCDGTNPIIRNCNWVAEVTYFQSDNVEINNVGRHSAVPLPNGITLLYSDNVQVVGGQVEGGVWCEGSDNVVIDDCRLGGTRVDSSSVELTDCESEGISNQNQSSLVMKNCVVRDVYSIHYQGAAITNTYDSSLQVENSTFINNWRGAISNGYYDEKDYNENCSLTVIDCVFEGNKTSMLSRGGAISNNEGTTCIVRGSKFLNNEASHSGGQYAGGIYNGRETTVEVTDCIFSENTIGNASDPAGGSGAMVNYIHSNVTVTECKFVGNNGGDVGIGGIYNFGPIMATVTDCEFTDNIGSGLSNFHVSDLKVSGCSFINNGMGSGSCDMTVDDCVFVNDQPGGLWVTGLGIGECNATITNCMFSISGGRSSRGVKSSECDPVIKNCLFVGNVGDHSGYGLEFGEGSNPTIRNCVFSGNSGGEVGGGILGGDSGMSIANSIFWGNTPTQISESLAVVLYCDVEGGYAGDGNIDVDPLFASPGHAEDGIFVMGDYHLKSQGGRWDDGLESWVVDDVTSPCIDAGDMMASIGVEPFPNGGILNMGAYGGTGQASKSYFGAGPCVSIIAGDINGDCVVDLFDFSIMAMHWMESSAL